jgi:hypothetical protein
MLRIEPVRWFSWDFTVDRDGRRLATLDLAWWRERGELVIDGQPFGVARQGLLSGDFRLTAADGRLIAAASKPSVLRRRFDVVYGGHTLTLQARSTWGRAMDVHLDGLAVGGIVPAGAWTRRASATLPDSVPLPVQVFVIWLAMLLWKREHESAAA